MEEGGREGGGAVESVDVRAVAIPREFVVSSSPFIVDDSTAPSFTVNSLLLALPKIERDGGSRDGAEVEATGSSVLGTGGGFGANNASSPFAGGG